MSHPKLYPAKPDPKAPHGWVSECGMFYKPDWGDRLVDVNGQPYIEITQVLSYSEPGDVPTVPPLSSAIV